MLATNIILIMCVDRGYGSVGFNGNPIIQTPSQQLMGFGSYASMPVGRFVHRHVEPA